MKSGFFALTTRIARPLAAAAALTLATAANAAYPDKSVRLVVGFAPGGSDISGRIVAQKLSQLWGQSIVVDNKPGAAGNIGADLVARAAPDGYTLLLAVNSYTINTTVYRNLSWDLQRDFVPIARYGTSPMVVVVNEKLPVRTLPELVAHAKANPGKLNYGSAGQGTAPHLVVEQFLQQTGTSMAHIPYKGSAPSVTAVLADEVQVAFGAQSAFESFIKAGKLRTLAVTTEQRSQALPDVPTVREAMNIDFDADIWYGLLAPANTPPAIVQKISDDLRKVLADPETQTKLREVGVTANFLGSQDMRNLIQRDVAKWREVANRIKLTMD
ncbi:tripartite tricarboxylate transporter substrate binding protein [Piscinibacter sakaiensis]|uniref:tripartite tricarboxylate transporter substrate binding protein n=1 Tax=Piscinibacter sakaiensis TaxID=1547922 RepID=UPI003AAC0169